MADQATIDNAIATLQRAMERYSVSYTGSSESRLIDGQLPQGLYEDITAFVDGLTGIENVSRTLYASNFRQTGGYDFEIGAALNAALIENAPDFVQMLEERGEDGFSETLRRVDAPDIFIRNPALFVEFAQNDLAGIIEALNVLEEDRLLNGPPIEPELRAAQPAALAALEENLRGNAAFTKNYLDAEQARISDLIAELPDDAPEETRAGLERTQGFIAQASERIALMQTRLDSADFSDFANNADAQEALSLYVTFLQKNNVFSRYDVQDGEYSREYAAHLSNVNAGYAERLTVLEDNENRTPQEESEYQLISRQASFQSIMDEMVRTKAYLQPVAEVSASPVDQARPVIEGAIGYMVRTGAVNFDPVLGERDNYAFEYDSRLTLQAFLIDLKGDLGITVEPGSAAYTPAFRAALQEELTNPAQLSLVANKYFKGNPAMAAGLIAALDTYSNPQIIPDIAGVNSNISAHNLLVRPEISSAEIPVISAALSRIPAEERLAVNELVTTFSGFGLQHIVPQEALDADMLQSLRNNGQSRDEILSDFFAGIHSESLAALEQAGRPVSDLEAEMTRRIQSRLDDVFTGNNIFSTANKNALEDDIARAVQSGLQAYAVIGSNDAERLEAGATAFAAAMPSTGDFLQEHGINRRNYALFNRDTMEGVTPSAISGFGGVIAKAEVNLETALAAPLIDGMIADISADFEHLASVSIAGRTMQGVNDGLAEIRGRVEGLYDSLNKNPDGFAIVQDRHGESLLLSPGESGLEIRYLDAAGISGLSDGAVPVNQIDDTLNLDALLIQTALAGYQAHNYGVESINNYNPEFFEMNGQHFVVGMDKQSATLQIIPLDTDFVNATNAAMLNYATGADNAAAARAVMMNDPAYRFIYENYAAQFGPAGTADKIFETMARELSAAGGAQAQAALDIYAERDNVDIYAITPYQNLPVAENPAAGTLAKEANLLRAEEARATPFLYLYENPGGEAAIFVAVPQMKTQIREVDGQQIEESIVDLEAPPLLHDITDPRVFGGMREQIILWDESGIAPRMDILPINILGNPAFADFQSWMAAGAPPPEKIEVPPPVVPEPLEGHARIEGLRDAFASAAGLEIDGAEIELGQPITNMAIIYDILGYDPHDAFQAAEYRDPASTYIVHGLEPDVWNGSDEYDEFTRDHILVTFQKDGALQTIAMAKEDLAYNPLRAAAILGYEHEGESAAIILAADRNRSEYVEGRGTIIHTDNIWTYVYNREQEYTADAPNEGMLEDIFVLPRRWGIDGRRLQEELMETLEEDHGALSRASGQETMRAMLESTIAEITMPDNAALQSDGGHAPHIAARQQDMLKV